jgi:hypothetical protein
MKLNEMSVKELYTLLQKEFEGTNLELFMEIDDIQREFERRKLPLPIPLIPAPKTIIIDIIDVEAKTSPIIRLDNKKNGIDIDSFFNHPWQARVLAMDKGIEWPELYVGAKLLLKSGESGVVRYKGVSYGFITYSQIIAIE